MQSNTLIAVTAIAVTSMGWALGLAPASAAEPAFPGAPPVIPCLQIPPPGLSCVPGGPFIRGSNEKRDKKDQKPQATVWLQTFYMDQNEVTYQAYKACEKTKKCDRAGPSYSDFNRPKQPINGISWFNAVQFCEAQGKRLPTEAEWEKAARGVDGRRFPWGDERATCKRAIIKDAKGRSCGVKKRGRKPEKGRPWVIGSRPPTQFGLYDMAGNSWEWVQDWYSPSYKACGEKCLGVNPRGPCDGSAKPCPKHTFKVVRGGSWYWPAAYATTTYRRRHFPANKPFHHFGFRCAASPEQAKALAP